LLAPRITRLAVARDTPAAAATASKVGRRLGKGLVVTTAIDR
jgi:hypothetical protein